MNEKYRIESGPFVGQVDVADGVIVAAPNVWNKFIGSPLHRLTWWLAKCNGSCKQLSHSALITPNSVSTVTEETTLCSDCPPVGYPTDITRCAECPRKATLADVELPAYCGCNELLQNLQELETHVERGCWKRIEK